MAAGGARAAGPRGTPDRRHDGQRRERPGGTDSYPYISAGPPGPGLGRRPQRPDRLSLGVGNAERARAYAAELVSLAPDVILANGTPALAALHRATRSIPVVFVAVVDPVGAGYVQSLARPGGDITGFCTFEPEIGSKWLELLPQVTGNR
jgi:ABC transporter substrate binding protein